MQCLNSIERFLFSSDIYLILEKNQEDLKDNPINNPINTSNQNKNFLNQSKNENEKEKITVPLKLLGSIINLYFYSNNPKQAYESLTIKNNIMVGGMNTRRNRNSLSRISSFQSNSMYLSESNNFGENEISGDTQGGIGIISSRPKNLEDFIVIKLKQSEIYLIDYNLSEASIEYKHICLWKSIHW